ncbi:MAG: response regulator [Desulfatitalea sp.]|nr:response regulator [Desulfatitalea sp.]
MQRELTNAGYEVLLAENGRQVLFWIDRHASLDLAILDLDLPDTEADTLFEHLRHRIPSIPIVVHSHPDDDMKSLDGNGVYFVEKKGNSIEGIIQMVGRILAAGAPAI